MMRGGNEQTLLRFYGDDPDEVPVVGPTLLANLVDELKLVFAEAAHAIGMDAEIDLTFRAGARRGSLEIPFDHVFLVVDLGDYLSGMIASKFPAASVDDDVTPDTWINAASLLWMALFGGSGIVHLILNQRRANFQKIPDAVARTEPANPLDTPDLRLILSEAVLQSTHVTDSIVSLTETLMKMPARSVTIEVNDEAPCVLFDRDKPSRFESIFVANDTDVSCERIGREYACLMNDDPHVAFWGATRRGSQRPVAGWFITAIAPPSEGLFWARIARLDEKSQERVKFRQRPANFDGYPLHFIFEVRNEQ